MEASGGERWETARRAGAWLAHPISIAALVVMVINDHLLKQAYGTWWTGKLSDAAGLVFFPALVGLVVALVAPRLTWRATVAVALGATAAGFAWVKVTSGGAAAASDLLSAVAGPSLLGADATDLLALPFLALAAWIATRKPLAPRWLAVAVLPVAVLASAATSQDTSVDGIVAVHSVEGQVLAGSGYLDYPEPVDPYEWWTSDGADDFVPIDDADVGATRFLLNEQPNTFGPQCLEWQPDTCYRPYADHLGVERSTDGGVTWLVDWEIPPVQRAAMAEGVETFGQFEANDYSYVETLDVAILGDAAGYYVYAANGVDGVAMRDPAGTWERIGTPGYKEWSPAEPLPTVTDPESLRASYVFWLVCAASLVIAAIAIGAAFVLAPGTRTSARNLWIIGAFCSWIPLIAVLSAARDFATDLGKLAVLHPTSLVLVAITTLACVTLMALGVLVSGDLRGPLAVIGMVAAAALAGAAAAAMPVGYGAQLVLGVLCGAVLAAAGWLVARRWLIGGQGEPTA